MLIELYIEQYKNMATAMKLMMMQDINRVFVSAYRPILMTAYISDGDVAHLRGELYIDSGYQNGIKDQWVSTGVMMNAYTKTLDGTAQPGMFEFNVMEYCRHYTGQANSPMWSWATYVSMGRLETNRFQLRIWPVRYSATAQGQTYDALEDIISSTAFIATPANTDINISTSSWSTFGHLDRYTLGANLIAGSTPETTLPLTRMPNPFNNDYRHGQHISMFDQQGDSLYTYFNKTTSSPKLYVLIIRYNDGINATGADFIDVTPKVEEKFRLPVHPKSLDMFLAFSSGAPYNKIVNASGELICKRVAICMMAGSGFFSINNFWSTSHYENTSYVLAHWQNIHYDNSTKNFLDHNDFNKVHDINQGKCERTKFIFQNRLGGFDWFSSYGTHKQGVTLSGTKYERGNNGSFHNGYHTRTWLNTEREDNYTVVTQPVDKKTALWLSELATSARVWVQMPYEHVENHDPMGANQLFPILINPNTFELYSSDESTYFVQFEYTLSSQKTQPRG
tara:strand:+ start:2608 stop:4131 length:1524 start_codon:yes stop_codon:yes gene_type:complete